MLVMKKDSGINPYGLKIQQIFLYTNDRFGSSFLQIDITKDSKFLLKSLK